MYKLQTHEGLASYINTNPSSQQFRYTPPSNDIDPQQSKQTKKNQLRDTGVDPEVSLRQRAAKLLVGASALKAKDPQAEQMRKEAAGLLSSATSMEKENENLMREV
jgi:hypothetical protein